MEQYPGRINAAVPRMKRELKSPGRIYIFRGKNLVGFIGDVSNLKGVLANLMLHGKIPLLDVSVAHLRISRIDSNASRNSRRARREVVP